MKKAGIIIGIIFIVAAILVFVLAQVIENRKIEAKNPEIPKQTEVVVVEVEEPDKPVIEVEKDSVKEEIKVPVKITTTVKEISDSILAQETQEYEEIVVISSKKLLLIDEAVGEKQGKSIVYTFNTMTATNRVLKLYITESVYNQFKVGDKLKVEYKIIKNDVGTEFPLIKKVTTTE